MDSLVVIHYPYRKGQFLLSQISHSRFLSQRRLRLPIVDSPAVENTLSIGADDAEIVKIMSNTSEASKGCFCICSWVVQ